MCYSSTEHLHRGNLLEVFFLAEWHFHLTKFHGLIRESVAPLSLIDLAGQGVTGNKYLQHKS